MQFSPQTMIHTHTTRRDSGNATSAFPLFLSSKISPRPPSKKKPKIVARSACACNSGPSARPPAHKGQWMDGGAEACGSVVRPTLTGSTLQHSPHHRAHKIFHLLRATAPTPAAVLLLPSGRARRPCAASLAPAGGGDGEAEEPWKSMETTRRIIKQSAVERPWGAGLWPRDLISRPPCDYEGILCGCGQEGEKNSVLSLDAPTRLRFVEPIKRLQPYNTRGNADG